ncbi:MAG: hypothetical protein ACE15F_12850 [bacterium]
MLESRFLEYTITPEIKLVICSVMAASLFVVYIWNPGRKRKKRELIHSRFLEYMEIDPGEYGRSQEKRMIPDIQPPRPTPHPMLEQLDEYVKNLKVRNIRNIDEM